MFIVLIRTIILYAFVVISMRIMGKRQIGELQPFELAVALIISELASLPMQDTRIPLINGIIPIVTVSTLQLIISWLELKSESIRTILSGKPSILINNGKIDIKQMKEQRFNLNDLLEELRLGGYPDISQIQYAILETSGKLSIVPKLSASPVTKADLSIKSSETQMPVSLIMDGKVNKKNLLGAKKNEAWLKKELRKNNVSSPKEVFIAILDSNDKFFFQLKE